jgi:hypothetical protein
MPNRIRPRLRLVAGRQTGNSTQPNSSPSSIGSESSSTKPSGEETHQNTEEESLGNKLQRLAFLDPDMLRGIEMLVDTRLEECMADRHATL